MAEQLQIVTTNDAPAAIGPYSQAVRYGNLLYTAGQIPLDPQSGQITGSNVSEQTRQVLLNLSAVLKAGSSSIEHVIKTTVYLTDMSNFGEMNAVYEQFFGSSRPARSTVAVAGLPRNALVEIECVAAVDE